MVFSPADACIYDLHVASVLPLLVSCPGRGSCRNGRLCETTPGRVMPTRQMMCFRPASEPVFWNHAHRQEHPYTSSTFASGWKFFRNKHGMQEVQVEAIWAQKSAPPSKYPIGGNPARLFQDAGVTAPNEPKIVQGRPYGLPRKSREAYANRVMADDLDQSGRMAYSSSRSFPAPGRDPGPDHEERSPPPGTPPAAITEDLVPETPKLRSLKSLSLSEEDGLR